MLKRERLLQIQRLVNATGFVSASDISTRLGVSTMTIRRDLAELDEAHLLQRIHGGAQSVISPAKELTRLEKRELHVREKQAIARAAAALIAPGDTVYIGPGTTNERIADDILATDVRIVTSSLPVFESFQPHADRFRLQLVGGDYRPLSGAFIGSLTNDVMTRLRPSVAFVSANGIADTAITDATPEEGQVQRIALENADRCYILADSSKLDHCDFYTFYQLDQVDGLITDDAIAPEATARYQALTQVIVADPAPA